MELVENEAAVPIELTASQASSIKATSAHWRKKLRLRTEPISLSGGRDGSYSIEARGVAGFIRVGETTLEIAPKFINRGTIGAGWRAAMWRFLAYGRGIQALADAAGSQSRQEGIADVLADIFLHSLRGAAARGYPVGYCVSPLDAPFLKGRLDPRKYRNLIPPTGKLSVLASTLTTDTPTNRLLKWAGNKLAAVVEEPQRRRQLINWLTELPGVSSEPPLARTIPLPRRHHPYLVHSLEIAKLLLDDWRAGYDSGELLLPGFLWDSEDLFERAARRLASDACRMLGLSVEKAAIPLVEFQRVGASGRLYTTPDIMVKAGETPVLLLDAKYKYLSDHPNNDDIYQVLAGGRAAGVKSVGLIYPADNNSITSKSYFPVGHGDPKSLSTLKIGLISFSSRSELKSLKSKLAIWIREKAN